MDRIRACLDVVTLKIIFDAVSNGLKYHYSLYISMFVQSYFQTFSFSQ